MTKRIKVFAHRSKDSNNYLGEQLELSEEAMGNFKYLGYEVELYYDVNTETGEGELVGAGGFFLGDETATAGEFDHVEQ